MEVVLLASGATLTQGASSLPDAWTLCELVLIPKAGKPLRSPSHLRPISLLPPQAKVMATVLATRIQEPVKAYLAHLPQYAYVEGRTIHQAVERVISHCAEVRNLVQGNTHTIHNKRKGRTSLHLYGGVHLSLDLTGAYDHVQWPLLRQALEDACIPERHIEAIMLVHHSARLQLRHCGMEKIVKLKRGLRQGCSLSPTLWAVFSGWLLKQMHQPQLLDVHRTNTSYADDQHYGWTIREGRDLERAYEAMRHILSRLLRAGLTISQDKTVVVLELQGSYATRALARYTVDRPQGKCFRFHVEGQLLYIKIVPKHVYLGAVIGFRKFEADAFKHRLTLARSTFSRLGVILRNKAVPLRLRLLLWKGCVWPALFHALDSTGLPYKELLSLQTQLIKQARAIAGSHSMFTNSLKETNAGFVKRLGLPDPVRRLQSALLRRVALDDGLSPWLAPGLSQMQRRHIVRGHLFDGHQCWNPSTPTQETPEVQARLVAVDQVLHETFSCDQCGQQFTTQASLRRHMYRHHFSEDQQQQRDAQVKTSIKGAEMAHALDGMPQCKHCKHAFSTWHAFHYHVNSRSCEGLRILYESPAAQQEALPRLTDALVASPEVLAKAIDCTWQDLELMPLVRGRLHHCVECNHWSTSPQYVRRHMAAKHPEHSALVQACVNDIKASKLSLANPCQFCGQAYKRKDAHLRACIGVFNGVYLHRRVARGKALTISGATPADLRSHVRQHDDAPRAERPLGADGGHAGAELPQEHGRSVPAGQERHGVDAGPTPGAGVRPMGGGEPASEMVQTGPKRPKGKRDDKYPPTQKEIQEMRNLTGIMKTYAVCANGSPNPPCTVAVQHRPEMACHQEGGPVCPAGSNASGAVSAHGRDHQGELPGHDEDTLLPLDGHGERVDLGRRPGGSCGQVGPGPTGVCEGCVQGEPGTEGDRGGAHGVAPAREGGARDSALPCDQAAGGRLRVPGGGHVPGGGAANEGSADRVEPPTHAHEIGGLGSGRMLLAPREDANECPGQETRWPDAVISAAIRLMNRHNFCYANALLLSLIHLDGNLTEPSIFGGSLHLIVRRLSSERVFHLWDDPEWMRLTERWEQPHRQHHVTEFLLHVAKWPQLEAARLTVPWQARVLPEGEDHVQIVDMGQSAPLGLIPPCTLAEDARATFRVQDLVNCWHGQSRRHAAVHVPSAVILQVGRFHFDALRARAIKRRYRVLLDRVIHFPVYVRDMQCAWTSLRLSSAVIHQGNAPTHGHYRSLLYDAERAGFWF